MRLPLLRTIAEEGTSRMAIAPVKELSFPPSDPTFLLDPEGAFR